MSIKQKIKALLKARKLTGVIEEEIAMKASNNRVDKIELLSIDESKRLLELLNSLAPECIIDGLYSICFELKIIQSKVQNIINDGLIIGFYETVFNMKFNYERIIQMDYLSLSVMAGDLGKMLIEKKAKLN